MTRLGCICVLLLGIACTKGTPPAPVDSSAPSVAPTLPPTPTASADAAPAADAAPGPDAASDLTVDLADAVGLLPAMAALVITEPPKKLEGKEVVQATYCVALTNDTTQELLQALKEKGWEKTTVAPILAKPTFMEVAGRKMPLSIKGTLQPAEASDGQCKGKGAHVLRLQVLKRPKGSGGGEGGHGSDGSGG